MAISSRSDNKSVNMAPSLQKKNDIVFGIFESFDKSLTRHIRKVFCEQFCWRFGWQVFILTSSSIYKIEI